MAADQLIVDHLRVYAPRRAAPSVRSMISLRLGMEQVLREVRRPAHHAPQAILVIRTLASRAAFGPARVVQQHWRRQLEDQLDELGRQALRPDRQYVPPQANCVLFDDEVALLLCYTRDLLAGRWAWYWDELFAGDLRPGRLDSSGGTPGRRLLEGWLAYPHAVPHLLADLPEVEAAGSLMRLGSAELSRLVHSLHATFDLPRGALDAAAPDPAGRDQSSLAAPWQAWLPQQQVRDLAPAAVYVWGLSCALVRRPHAARGQAFAAQARQWLEQETAAITAAARRPEVGRGMNSSGLRGVADAQDAATDGLAGAARIGLAALPPAAAAGGVAPPATAQNGTATGSAQALTQTGTFTRLGGAILFINVLTLLGLPESIPALAQLSPWALLGGLTACMLGDRLQEFAGDPLWSVLDALVGQEAVRPWGAELSYGTAFQVPSTWHHLLPPARLEAYRESAGGRLQVWAAEPRYLLADLPRGTSFAAAQELWPALAETAIPPAGPDDLPAGAGELLAPALAWWVRRLQPFLAQLLVRFTGQGLDAAANLLYQPGTLYVSRTHVDLVLSVEQISIPLRRAGFDRTPGWRPEFGRIITIHFE